MALPGKRTVKRIAKRISRDRLLLRLHQIGPRDVYSGLLAYARTHKKRDGSTYSDGWAYYAVLEIFGFDPRLEKPADPRPLSNNLIDLWKAIREKPR